MFFFFFFFLFINEPLGMNSESDGSLSEKRRSADDDGNDAAADTETKHAEINRRSAKKEAAKRLGSFTMFIRINTNKTSYLNSSSSSSSS